VGHCVQAAKSNRLPTSKKCGKRKIEEFASGWPILCGGGNGDSLMPSSAARTARSDPGASRVETKRTRTAKKPGIYRYKTGW